MACALVAAAHAGAATPVHVVAIDGTKTNGIWVGINAGKVVIQADDKPMSFDADDLMVIDFSMLGPGAPASTFDRSEPPIAAAPHAVLYLADGGRITGELIPSDGERISLRTSFTGDLSLPFDQLAGIRVASGDAFPTSRELFDEALANRLPGQDVMITRGLDDVKALRGRLVRLGPDGGAFIFGDRERTFPPHRLFGIVFATGAAKIANQPLLVTLSDGASFGAEPLRADQEKLTLRTGSGAEVTVALAQVARIDVRSRRLVYVSDVAPASEHNAGRLHRATPARRDRAIIGGALRLGGVTYPKGLAMMSRTEMTYDLNGDYTTFAATVGIDDAVRPYGAVQLMVVGDGKTLLDIGTLTGLDDPRDIAVSVQSVKQLTLITDYGDGIDLSDHADWALARLLKKAGPSDRQP